MFAVLHSDINSHKSHLLYLTDQPYRKKSRSAKVKDGIINLFLRNYLVDQYNDSSTFQKRFIEWGQEFGLFVKGRHITRNG